MSNNFRTLVTVRSPHIVVLENFMNEAECADLITLAQPKLERSTVVHHEDGIRVDDVRTSSGCFFKRGEFPVLATLEERIAAFTGIPTENGEGMQILHYLPGQNYVPHHDYFLPGIPSNDAQITYQKGGQRVATFIVYMNTAQAGGETEFPTAGVKVEAVLGKACYFRYRSETGVLDPLSLHSGNPLVAGEKWIAVKWLREGRFIET